MEGEEEGFIEEEEEEEEVDRMVEEDEDQVLQVQRQRRNTFSKCKVQDVKDK